MTGPHGPVSLRIVAVDKRRDERRSEGQRRPRRRTESPEVRPVAASRSCRGRNFREKRCSFYRRFETLRPLCSEMVAPGAVRPSVPSCYATGRKTVEDATPDLRLRNFKRVAYRSVVEDINVE